jgi:ABC-type sugar transport system ATPase subunit
MKEIFEIGDRITVLKDGQVQGTFPVADMSEYLLIKKMTGRHLTTHVTSSKAQRSIALEVKKFSGNGFSDVNFQLYKGEILALAGLVGAGRTEIARALFGADPINGDYFIGEQPAAINHPGDAIAKGVVYIPEERKDKGLFMQMTMEENILSGSIGIRDRQRVHPRNKRSAATDMIRRLNISPILPDRKVIALSGGNQQKTVLAKWLLLNPQIIIADEPTHGIDVGAKFEIYQILQTLAKNGVSILLISSELPEILTLANRILVVYNGKITATLRREDATEEKIMRYASGIENMQIDL